MTSTDLEHVTEPQAAQDNLPARMEYAKTLAASSLLPKQFQNNPANVLLAIEFGHALGIPPIQAMQDIHVIEGKPSASANLIAALVRRAGHKLRVRVDDHHQIALAELIRADDPDFTYTARWDMEKAKTAGLTKNPNWTKHPGQMLRNRAITEVCRMGAGDALYGVHYSHEELENVRAEHVGSRVTGADVLGEAMPEPATAEPEQQAAEDYVEGEVVEGLATETGELPIDEWPKVTESAR